MLEKILASPVGALRLVASDAALVGVYFPDHRPTPRHAGGSGSNAVLEQAAAELEAWFGGERRVFGVPLAPEGTPFQRAVWGALATIPYGERWSYADLACAIGRPSATRAVAAANGRNPLSILVPCHRVIGSDGSLTGYAGGLDAKRWLLAHEAGQGAASQFSGSERSFLGRSGSETVRSETGNAGGTPQTSRSAVEARHGAGAVLA